MSINITSWKPDTCDCELHYSWDNSLSEDLRVHVPVASVTTNTGEVIPRKVCAIHDAIDSTIKGNGKHVDHYNKVKDENTRKNKVLGRLLEAHSTIAVEVINEEGVPIKEFRKGMEPDWSFDSARNLIVKLNGSTLKKVDKDSIKLDVETLFQKVVIV